MKRNINELLKIANNQYDFELVIRHNKRLEKAIKDIDEILISDLDLTIKNFRIRKEIEKIKKYIV